MGGGSSPVSVGNSREALDEVSTSDWETGFRSDSASTEVGTEFGFRRFLLLDQLVNGRKEPQGAFTQTHTLLQYLGFVVVFSKLRPMLSTLLLNVFSCQQWHVGLVVLMFLTHTDSAAVQSPPPPPPPSC